MGEKPPTLLGSDYRTPCFPARPPGGSRSAVSPFDKALCQTPFGADPQVPSFASRMVCGIAGPCWSTGTRMRVHQTLDESLLPLMPELGPASASEAYNLLQASPGGQTDPGRALTVYCSVYCLSSHPCHPLSHSAASPCLLLRKPSGPDPWDA